MSTYEEIGEQRLTEVVQAFVDAFFRDFVIGFLFEGRDRERIVRHELELARAHLGGPAAYRGRPLGSVHQPLKINRGHFRRRLAILRHVLVDQGLSAEVVEAWVAHDAALEAVVTTGADCVE